MMCKKINLLIPGDFPPIISGISTYFYEIWKLLPSDKRIIIAPRFGSYRKIDREFPHRVFRVKVPINNKTFEKIKKGLIYLFYTFILHLKHRIKIIHCGQVLSSGFVGWFMNKLFKIPYVIYIYGSETYRFGRLKLFTSIMKIFLESSSKIIANSNFTKNEYIEFGINPEKIKIITPGVDIGRFYPQKKDEHLLEKFNLRDKKILLTVGRLDERKGHDKVIEALSKLKSKYPDLTYLIVGSGREEKRLQNIVKNYALEDYVVFVGYVPDEELPRYYNLCDIFILLNRQTEANKLLKGDYEGFGIVFIEASACGKPIIAGNFGGVYDAVENGKTGLVIDPVNIEEIIKSIEYFLSNPENSFKFGNRGLNRVRQSFTWDKKAREIITIENEILN